jgi:hypothetical protein
VKEDSDLNFTNVSDDDDDLDDAKVSNFVLRRKESTANVKRFPAPREPRSYQNSDEHEDNESGGVRNSRDSDAFASSFKPRLIARKSVDSLRSSRDTIEEMERNYRSQSNSWVETSNSNLSHNSSLPADAYFEHSSAGDNKENSADKAGICTVKPRNDRIADVDDDDEDDIIEIDVLKQAEERAAKAKDKVGKAGPQNILKDSVRHTTPPNNKGQTVVFKIEANKSSTSPVLPRKSGRYDDEDEREHVNKFKNNELESTARSSSEWERLVNDIEGKNTGKLAKPVVPFALQASMTHANSASGLVRCFVLRDKSTAQAQMYPTYELYLEEPTRKLIAVATKMGMNRTSNYHLFDMTRGFAGTKFSKKSGNYLGKLRAHDSKRTQYSLLTNSSQKEEIAGINFEALSTLNFLTEGSQPRKIFVAVPHLDFHKCPIPNKIRDDDDSASLSNILKKGVFTNRAMCFQNKEPVLENGTYRLNFGGRVSKPSVKNFQLVPMEQPDNVVCQFGKVSEDRFNLDFKAPICPLQAFSFALCQFNL